MLRVGRALKFVADGLGAGQVAINSQVPDDGPDKKHLCSS